MKKENTIWAVTGTYHGSLIEASSEGEARRIFHAYWGGESIIHIVKRGYYLLLN